MGRPEARVSAYDSIARLYDPWSRSVTEDVSFYVDEAVRAGSPVVELGVGTGRIAVPVAAAGVHVIGVDASAGMLEVCREHAETVGVADLLDLRLGDLTQPPVDERVRLVTCPFRSLLHMLDDDQRLRALRAAWELLVPGGRFVFDVFAPAADDIRDTHGRWLEREDGIFERADWDTQRADAHALRSRRRGRDDVHPCVALDEGVARPPRARWLPGRRLLRLVRQAPVPRRRGQRLDRAAAGLTGLGG